MEVNWDFFPGDKTESNHFGIPYFSVIIFNSKTGLNRNRTTADSGLVVDSVNWGVEPSLHMKVYKEALTSNSCVSIARENDNCKHATLWIPAMHM